MPALDVSIKVYFGLEYAPGSIGIYDDPVRGVYDDATYVYASEDGVGVEVAGSGFYVHVRRGRSRELDDFVAGVATVSLRNFDRTFDALNAAGAYYGDITPGKRVEIAVFGQTIFTGTIEDWNLLWDVSGEATAEFTAIDALGQLARIEFDAWTTTASQQTGARVAAVLDRSEVAFPASRRDLDTGVSTLQADNVTWGSNVLNYLQLVNRSERGWLFASRSDLVTFLDRHNLVGATVGLTYADDGTGAYFHGIDTDVGSELLYNRVGVDREGGTLQTVEDDTSQAAYGVRTLSLTGLLMDSDAQSLAMAEYLTSIYKDPTARVSRVACKVHDRRLTAVQQAALAATEIGDVRDVVWTPRNTGSAIERVPMVVEGVEHQLNTHEYLLSVSLAPAEQTAVAIYDDPVRGVYDDPTYVYAF